MMILIVILLLVIIIGGYILLSKIHVLVNSRLTTAMNEITTLKTMLTDLGVRIPEQIT